MGQKNYVLDGKPASHHYLYTLWWNIRRRCYDSKHQAYKNYGGRGIRVSITWQRSFERFVDEILSSIGSRPGPEYSLDRINNDGHYQQGNVRWATIAEQNANMRKLRFITYAGETHTMAEWARIRGMKYVTLKRRIRKGWSIEDALNKPVQLRRINRKSSL